MMRRVGTVVQQLAQAEAELKEEREQRILEPFYEEVGRRAMMAVQSLPYKEWPPLLRMAFSAVERGGYLTTASIARERLPK